MFVYKVGLTVWRGGLRTKAWQDKDPGKIKILGSNPEQVLTFYSLLTSQTYQNGRSLSDKNPRYFEH